MALIGQRNRLTILFENDSGYYLDGGEHGEILLPGRYIPRGSRPGEIVDVFVYRDSEDRLVATTERPYAMVGEFASLRVVSVNPRVGIFLDWGLSKDLLLPIREQKEGLMPGYWVIVHVLLDTQTDRIIASARISRHLNLTSPTYAEGQEVKLLITGPTPLGYNAIVNNAHNGLLYASELSGPLKMGQRFTGYIKTVRADGKIDLSLDRAGHQRIPANEEIVLKALTSAGGRLPFHDGSSPEAIREKFGMSKKAFKQAIGSLFKARRIMISPDEIKIVAAKK
ncbi:MAG: S1-like domain-containing RNA-binding protein [Opitutaceae bacterium]